MINILQKTQWKLTALVVSLCISFGYVHAQTVLVSPTGAGGFELGSGSLTDNGWTVVNSAQTIANRWYTGSGLTSGGYSFPNNTRCAYVSGDGGATWSYTNQNYEAVHFYRDITVPAGESNVVLSFTYQQNGANNAKFLVYACPVTLTPTVGQPTAGSTTVGTNAWGTGAPTLLLNSNTPQLFGNVTFTAPIPPELINNCGAPGTFRLVFTWNSSTSINNPPAAVDEISVTSYPQVPAATLGTFTINKSAPTSGTNFNTFTEAVNWLNAVSACGISNPITFNIAAGQSFYEDVPPITASGSAANQITFRKSGSGLNPRIVPPGIAGNGAFTPGSVDAGLCLAGADYVTIDGINIIAGNANIEFGYLIRNASTTNGASNNTIKNTTILLDRTNINSRGIMQSASATVGGGFSASTSAGCNNNNKYYNLTIGNVYYGVQLYGTSDGVRDQGNQVGTTAINTYNTIGRSDVPNDIGNGTAATFGINLLYQESSSVFNNKISNVTSTANTTADGIVTGAHGTTPFGGISGNSVIYNNIISNINRITTSGTATSCGMRIQHYTSGIISIKIYNNVISNIGAFYTGTASNVRAIKGIFLPTTTTLVSPNAVSYEIVNNSVVIDGSASPAVSSIVFESNTTSPAFIIRNNLFSNITAAQSGVAVHYGVAALLTTAPLATAQGGPNRLGAAGSLSNYNDIYIQNTTNGYVGAYTTTSNVLTNLPTLTNWQANFTSPAHDANSISADPLLNSSAVLVPFYGSPLAGSFPSLAAPYNTDITGTTRSLSSSTIGAYESVKDAIAPVMNDVTLLNVYTTSNRVLPGLLTITDNTAVSVAPGLAPRIYFKRTSDANTFGVNNSSASGWKWVEASNTTSPFNFTIDYVLLPGGVANTNDTIQYFYLAQDTLTVPNITVLPAAGFAGTTVAAVSQAPTTPKSYIIFGTPATYVNATIAQGSTAKVEQGSVNNQLIRVAVETNATGAPAYVSSITFNSNGTNDFANISGARVWFTGSNPDFATVTQFGNTQSFAGSGPLGNFTFNGNQLITNGISYFWLSYDMNAGAVVNDSVDASVVSVTYNGTVETPSVTTVSGNRKIKAAYCKPVISSGNYCISNVSFNTLNSTTGGCGTVFYNNYLPAGSATTTLLKGLQYNLSVTVNNSSTKVYAMFDYNDNGVFDPSEIMQVSTTSSINVPVLLPVNIPCDIATSELRMRIRSIGSTISLANYGCDASASSEVEDYTLTVLDNPVLYASGSATQASGMVSQNSANVALMHIPVTAKGCGPGIFSEMICNTAASTNPLTNIATAKLYATGKTTIFNSNKLLATIVSPSGTFTFNGFSDTLMTVPGDTNHYWIAYDIAPGATINDTIDVRVDSMYITGAYHTPSNNDPAEVMVIKAPMTYISSAVTHPDLNRVALGNTNTRLLKVEIVMSAAGAPVQANQFDLTTLGGGVDTANIQWAKMYYTGNNPAFSATTQFGLSYSGYTPAAATWSPYSINGVQPLVNGSNYFWLVYDLKNNAIQGDSVDATLSSFGIEGNTIVPTTHNTPGNLIIRNPYCASLPTSANFEEIFNVTLGTLNNTSACGTTGGANSIMGRYSDYTELTPTNVLAGTRIPFSVTTGSCGSQINDLLVIYIDWNQNGLFTDLGETVYTSATYNTSGSSNAPVTLTGAITVPCDAVTGQTRMRVLLNGQFFGATVPCGSTGYSYGETEDYTLNVVRNPVSVVSIEPAQKTTYVAVGTLDNMIMRIPVKAQGCGTGILSELYFNTGGSSRDSVDIANAKLYKTGNSASFSTTNLIGTFYAPKGSFSFTGLNDTLLSAPSDTNNYWLTYDIAGGATLSNIVDAVLDSIHAINGNHIPVVGNPSGSGLVSNPMTVLSTTAIHPDLSKTARGTLNKKLLRVSVVTSSTGAPAFVNNMTFSTNGGSNDGTNIDSIRVFYTGNSASFNTATPFGTAYRSLAGASWGAFTINGDQPLLNDTNYFWLTYDVKPTALIGDSMDAEYTILTVNSGAYTPLVSAPAGNVIIRQDYCASNATTTNVNIGRVRIGSRFNESAACALTYTNYTTLPAFAIRKNELTNFAVTTRFCSGFLPDYAGNVAIFIDYNQNGSFADPGEAVYNSGVAISQGDSAVNNFAVPCGALPGETRMRVILYNANSNPSLSACGSYLSYGETEDYLVTIIDNPQSYVASEASQKNGLVAPGVDEVMMRVKVKAKGCGNGEVNAMYFNTARTTNAGGNIVAAKLYATGTSNVFSTSNLLGTYSAPVGQFSFFFNDVLSSGMPDSNNYWLVYEVSGGATLNDTLDVRIDSVDVMGASYVPMNNDPVQYKTIDFPMSYISSSVQHPGPDLVASGSANVKMLRLEVVTSATGSPISLTQLNLNTNGGINDTVNIAAARIYYTGNSNVFAATNQFGPTYPVSVPTALRWPAYTVTGSQALTHGSNYFWLVYDLKSSANIGDSVDAELTALTVAGTVETPGITAPAGNTLIRSEYCIPGPVSGGRCITNVTFGDINNTSGTTCTSPYYTLYPNAAGTTTNVYRGATLPINITIQTNSYVVLFIDLNRNGVFSDLGEQFNLSTVTQVSSISQAITIPVTASLGQTRMRVRTYNMATGGPGHFSCADYNNSETEDYIINVLPEIPPTTYEWNQTVPGDFAVASNWTPARVSSTQNDRLVFGTGTPSSIIINNVSSQNIATIEVLADTRLKLNAATASSLSVNDSLILNANAIISTSNTLTTQIGKDITVAGKLIREPGSGINGTVKRWINGSSTDLIFPLSDSIGTSRNVEMNYTTLPSSFGSVTASFVPAASSGNAGLPLTDVASGISINRIAPNGYWNITSGDGLTGGAYTGAFSPDSFSQVTIVSALILVNRIDQFNNWVLNGTSVSTTGTNESPVVSRANMNQYGQFAIGSDSAINTLPVTLSSFGAQLRSSDVLVKWITSSEINNRGFEVERSGGKGEWQSIGFVKGKGNSNFVNAYSFTDPSPFTAQLSTLYYRLKQVDNDGRSSYSAVASVTKYAAKATSVSVSPNPFSSSYNVSFEAANEGSAVLKMTDIQGRVVAEQSVSITKGSNSIHMDQTGLQAGVYFVNITVDGETQVLKLVKQ